MTTSKCYIFFKFNSSLNFVRFLFFKCMALLCGIFFSCWISGDSYRVVRICLKNYQACNFGDKLSKFFPFMKCSSVHNCVAQLSILIDDVMRKKIPRTFNLLFV